MAGLHSIERVPVEYFVTNLYRNLVKSDNYMVYQKQWKYKPRQSTKTDLEQQQTSFNIITVFQCLVFIISEWRLHT